MAYFFAALHVHSAAGLPQPEQTLSLIGLPHVLHGLHPHVWHMTPLLFTEVGRTCHDLTDRPA